MRSYGYSPPCAIDDFDFAETFLFELLAEGIGIGFRRHGNHSRTPAARLLNRGVKIVPCSERHDLKAIRVRFGDTERAAANRTGRSQDGDSSHLLVGECRRIMVNPLALFLRFWNRNTARGGYFCDGSAGTNSVSYQKTSSY